MLYRLMNAAILATLLTTGAAQAQSLSQISGPVNLPPAGFDGQQFVDNRGCLFVRAGFGGVVNWVPRVDRQKRPVCGMPPTFGAAVIAAVEADMAPETPAAAAPAKAPAAPVVAAAPAAPAPVAPAPTKPRIVVPTLPAIALAAPAAPAQLPVAKPAAASYTRTAVPAGQVLCWPSAPRLERLMLRSGGTALVCTRGDGTLTGWRPPIFGAGAGVGAALSDTVMSGATLASSARPAAPAAPYVAAATIPTPPKGYKLAWDDDRLNPRRGLGTASGQAAQDQVWTREVPAELVTAKTKPAAVAKPRVTASTMSAPAADETPAAAGAAYVQVGTFGQPENAAGVRSRLSALGLPVSTSKITRKGKVLQIVYAGPFASAAQAAQALDMARAAGFSDAILR